jgi:hypothetical protein
LASPIVASPRRTIRRDVCARSRPIEDSDRFFALGGLARGGHSVAILPVGRTVRETALNEFLLFFREMSGRGGRICTHDPQVRLTVEYCHKFIIGTLANQGFDLSNLISHLSPKRFRLMRTQSVLEIPVAVAPGGP